ncbi:MAG: SDR family NAD(P)-dependent oxidoreductase, partial [Methylococcaceae bacterium]
AWEPGPGSSSFPASATARASSGKPELPLPHSQASAWERAGDEEPIETDPLAGLFYVPQWSRLDPAECPSAEPLAALAVFGAFSAGSQAPAWEPGPASSGLPNFGKLELPIPRSQASAWERAEPAERAERAEKVLLVATGPAEPPADVLRLADTAAWTAALADLPDPLQLVFLAPEQNAGLDADGGCLELLALLKGLAEAPLAGRKLRLLILTRQAIALRPDDSVCNPHAAALHGLALAAARELPQLSITCIDEDGSTSTFPELPITLSPVAIRAGQAYRRRLEPVCLPEAPSPYRQGGVYLIVGGAGGLGLALAEDLARRYQAQVFLTGRGALDENRRQAIAALGGASNGTQQPAGGALSMPSPQPSPRGRGGFAVPPAGCWVGEGRVRYLRADATDLQAMTRAIAEVEAEAGPLHGVFHCALVLADRALRQMDEATFLAALAPKQRAALVLAQCLGDIKLDFLAFFSSAQSFLGNAGQANYTAGCSFVDAWAAYLAQHRPYPVRVLNWGFWGETGAVASPEYTRRLKAQGILPIATQEGLAATERALAAPLLQIVPFRAESRFLAQAGIGQGPGLVARRPDYPAILPEIEAVPADAPALVNIAAGMQRLDRAAAEWFCLGLIEAGWIAPGSMQAEDGLPHRLPSRFHPLFRAALPLLERYGLLQRTDDGQWRWGAATPPDLDAIEQDCPELAAYVDLLRALVPAYAAILQGERAPTDLLFPEGSAERVAGIYQGHALADGLNRMAAAAVVRFVERCPATRLRILELGAGSGATAQVLLAALQPHAGRVSYVFSDLAPAFVKQAREALAERYPYARFEVRDINRTPEELGQAQYDIVVAANVLHATPDLRATLDHVRMLLKPNGLLLLNEVTENSPYATFTFGLLDGWWAFRDGLRLPGGPLLDRAGWRRVLAEQGFYGYAEGGFDGLGQHLMLANCGVLAPAGSQAPSGSHAPSGSQAPAWEPGPGSSSFPASATARASSGKPELPLPRSQAGAWERAESVERLIVTAMAETLEIDPEELNVDMPHAEFGLDSILGVEVVSRVNRLGGFELSATDLFNYPTIRELAGYIVASRGLNQPSAGSQAPAWEPDPGSSSFPEPGSSRASRSIECALHTSHSISESAIPQTENGKLELPLPRSQAGAWERAESASRRQDARTSGQIAVIGMACNFPGAPNLDAFWQLLKEGRDAVRPIPPERWSLARWYDPDPKQPGKTYSQWAGWLDGYDRFDPAFFNISPREAELMDPQQRQFLMVAWHALEHAGYGDKSLARQRCGIVAGAGAGDYRNRLAADAFEADGAYAFMGNSDAILAGRLAYFLDLKGPCLTLDTACSSSLVAVHLARESLLRGETDMVLAGGVTIQTTAQFHVLSAKAGMLSPTGRCRPFDAEADGIVPAEGVALVVLKRLEDALADGDHIHAVIAGSGVNQDGRSNGITAPNALSQTDLIGEVYRRHGIDPEQIGYVEAHGTGTRLGDPIEVEALAAAFRRYTARQDYCGLGSVKSNIGHALAAAGVAGLIKAILCLEHRTWVPSLHFRNLNPHIRLAGSPFRICRTAEDWPAPPGGVRHAAVSAFGFSGTNAHLVLREAPVVEETVTSGRARLPLALSAQTRTALRKRAQELAAWLREHPEARLEDLAATLWLGRAHLPYRLAVAASSAAEFRLWLEQPDLESLIRRCKPGAEPPVPLPAEAEDAVARLAAVRPTASDPDTVVRAYLEGWPLSWPALFEGVAFRRLVLPLYPFDTASYVVPSRDAIEGCAEARSASLAIHAALHPLIDRNTSTLEVQRFAWRPDPAADFLDQHRLGGQPVLPAVAFLEQARMAGVLSLPEPPNLIRGLELLQVLACRERPEVQILLAPDGAAARFEIVSEAETGQPRLHARGGLSHAGLPPVPPVPVEKLWEQAGEKQSGEACYAAIRRLGIAHGPAYRLLAETARSGRRVLARFSAGSQAPAWEPGLGSSSFPEPATARASDGKQELPPPHSQAGAWERGEGERGGTGERAADGWLIHPYLTDALLQAAAVYFTGLPQEDAAVAWLPALIETARIHAPGAAACWGVLTHVHGDPAQEDSVRFDASLLDGAGQTLLALEGVVFKRALPRAVPAVATARPAPAMDDMRERLAADVLAQVAAVLKVAPEDVDPDDDLSSYGFDSIGFTALASKLETLLGFALSPSVFFEHRTLAAFLDYLLGSQEQQLRRHYGIDHSHGLRSPLYTSPDDSPRCQNGGTPEGFKAISRGLSVATPPVDGPIKTPTTPEGSQKSGHNADCCDPSGVERIISLSNPGVSLTLNPRLMAGNPPGCKTEATTHMRIKRGAERGNDVQEPIAIVGLAGSMPGCRDLDEFWQKLLAVESMVREIPPERWDWQAIFGDPAGERNKCNIRYGAFLDGVDRFDPLFFGISPREAEAMDPQQRLFLETVWHAVENAGYRASALAGRKIGVFAGVANFDYNELWRARSGDINAHAATGTAHSIVPNRVSFLLDFKGPSEPVDTACSSGLVAVYRAMAAIRDGSCEMAVAGAVNVMLTPTLHIAFNKAGMLSQDGQCRTFDRDAAGYVRGEGVGAVLLKPLSKAEADGDTIHGVLLGGALYHGGHANSLTAPNPASQAELLVEAYRRAGVAVDRVSYVEAHGTGTRLGDPAEVSGLANAFARLREQQGGRLLPESCGLGSVKTNIGHLETAAGIAGLLKILLAMRHGQLPGNAHFRVQNPYIDLGNSPFYILRESRPWRPRDAGGQLIPRIAGISSFGFGGAYAHLVVQEGPGRPPAADTGREELFVFSARDPERLRALAQSWLDFARRQGNGVRLADAAHTARVGREAYACRLACLCGQWPTLAEALAAFLAGESHPALLEPNPDRSHAPRGNAAPDALRPVPTRTAERWEARSHAERGNDVELRDLAADWLAGGQPDWQAIAPASARRVPIPGYPFARESYWPPLEAPPADGALHPLAGANRATLYSQKYAARLEPGFALLRDHQVAGHGILPATAYLEWARAAGSLAAEQPIAVLADIVWQRPLLAGAKPVGIQALLEPQGDGVRFELCSGPDEAPLLHAQGWLSLETPEPPQDSLDLAAARSRLPVPWSEERCYGFFAELGLNYGPGFRVLREVAFNEREALGRLQPAVADPAYEWQPALLDGLLQTGAVLMAGYGEKGLLLPHALARFSVFRPLAAGGWVHVRLLGEPGPEGAALNLDYYDEAGNLLARMEGLEVRPVAAAPVRPPQPVEAGPVALAFRRCWEEISGVADARAPGTILVFDREGALFRALADAGADCRRVESVDDLAPAPASQPPGRLLAYFPASSPPAETLRTCAALLRGLGSTLARRRIPLLLAYGYAPSTPPPGLDGFARSAMQEYGGLRIRVLGLAGDPAGHAQEIVAELGRDDFHVRLDGSRRVAVLRSVELPEQAADLTGTTWLITGAGGALGRLMAEALAARGCRLALTGRRAPDEALHAFLATQEDRACYHACDLADADAVAQLVAETRRRFGPIHGLIHAAGVTADALIARKTAEQMEAVLAGKLEAAYRLDACLADAADLRWFVLFGSLAGVTGNIGQADYAYANAGLAHFAAWREAQRAEGRRHGLSLCLEWPYWRDGGMRLDERTLAFMEKQTGLAPLPTAIG